MISARLQEAAGRFLRPPHYGGNAGKLQRIRFPRIGKNGPMDREKAANPLAHVLTPAIPATRIDGGKDRKVFDPPD